MRIVDTYFGADGHIVTDSKLAVRIDRDVYDDEGQLVRRETWHAEPASKLGPW